jgi:serine/threonine protein kinase
MEDGSQGRQKFGRYTLLERVTTGGMAEVYRAMARGAQGFSRLVAIKKILPQYAGSREFQRMFVDEATIASRLNHANIAQVYDFDIHEGTPYIAMEFVEGKDLREILRTSHSLPRPVPYPVAVYLTLEAAKGLYYVHSRRESSRPLNIIHRDVSPQNIMLSFSGEVKIVDFGIARAVERETETVAGTIKGKYAYMSPEQLGGELIDHRTDIFSLGIVLWEMLTLERLFSARTDGETINNVLRRQIPEPHMVRPDIPAALSPIVMCALERNRSNRYPTMLAFHEALSSFLFETGSYPELERVTTFLSGLFPKEIEALRQGEHLTFTPTAQETPDPASEAMAATSPARPAAAAKQADPEAEDEVTVTATGATKPLGVVRERTDVRSSTHPAVTISLLVVVLGLAALFGWQFYERINGPKEAHSSKSGALASNAPQDSFETSDAQRSTRLAMDSPDVTSDNVAQLASTEDMAMAADTVVASQILDVMTQDGTIASPAGLPAEPELRLIAITIVTDPPDANIVIGKNNFRPGLIELKVAEDETVLVRVSKAGYATIEDRFEPLRGMERHYELRSQSHLEIWVEPKDAIVEVNGKELTRSGKKGYYVQEVGLHETIDLAIHRADYYPKNKTVLIDDAKVKEVIKLRPRNNAASLVERPSYGTVKISAKPYAEVYYGPEKESWGQVSASLKKTLPVGDHIIHLHHAGTDTWAVCNISVKEGYTAKCAHDFLANE